MVFRLNPLDEYGVEMKKIVVMAAVVLSVVFSASANKVHALGFTDAGSVQLGGSAALTSDEIDLYPYVNYFIASNIFIRPDLALETKWNDGTTFAIGPAIGYAYDGGWPFIPAGAVGADLLIESKKESPVGFRIPFEAQLIIPIRPDFSINPALRFHIDNVDSEVSTYFGLEVGVTGLLF